MPPRDVEKRRAYNRDYRRNQKAADPEAFVAREKERYHSAAHQNNRYKREYGITLAQFEEMATAQENRCGICLRMVDDGEKLVVDHVHDASKKVRGLLCRQCNAGLGFFGDSEEQLVRAIEYLRRHK